eukprot:CAMPEP_0179847814 /NCGR_PEP_ID=MMETSP0982-20121206/6286_1 /TAXON_ID=483367 /ORGANISM="non described non described, Strain CCMP 2436" /LENGTH=92 /DNA_ID=CAMNT_0021733029 /DNA_START=571 /DNA_END=849 /DNA_ORIENTATION=-
MSMQCYAVIRLSRRPTASDRLTLKANAPRVFAIGNDPSWSRAPARVRRAGRWARQLLGGEIGGGHGACTRPEHASRPLLGEARRDAAPCRTR